jgi:membrane-associated phospholipid phosphatase
METVCRDAAGAGMSIARARIVLFAFVGLAYAVAFPIVWLQGMAIDYGSFAVLLKAIVLPAAAGIVYAVFRRMEPMRVALEAILCGFLLMIPIGLCSYAAIGVNLPVADEALIRMDNALGFDWRAFIGFVDARPVLATVLEYAYQSFTPQLLLTPVLLVMFGKPVRAYAMVTAYGLLCLASSLISAWYPALGTYVVYNVTADSLANINAHFGFAFIEQFNGVRDDPNFIFVLTEMMGILTFPSVHAAVAALCAWALWDVRALRYPFLVLNILMAISAVSHANHYLVDVIAGIGVAAVAIALVKAVFRLSPGQRACEAEAATAA